MIYITGDIHGDPTRFSKEAFPEQDTMTKEDYVIICGDFGLVWDKEESKNERYWLNWLQNKPFTTLFVDGNHENHDRLDAMPVSEWNGGKVHFVRPNVIHLMRGQVFTLQGQTYFTFGGASSHDIQDGILDPAAYAFGTQDPDFKAKRKYLDSMNAIYRIKGVSWWKRELPNEQEMAEGLENLKKCENKVDYIISHSPCTSDMFLMGGRGLYQPDIISNYLEEVRATTEYKKWYFGHMHLNKQVSMQDICLYEQILLVPGKDYIYISSQKWRTDNGLSKFHSLERFI